jgi:hypothetical protein
MYKEDEDKFAVLPKVDYENKTYMTFWDRFRLSVLPYDLPYCGLEYPSNTLHSSEKSQNRQEKPKGEDGLAPIALFLPLILLLLYRLLLLPYRLSLCTPRAHAEQFLPA